MSGARRRRAWWARWWVIGPAAVFALYLLATGASGSPDGQADAATSAPPSRSATPAASASPTPSPTLAVTDAGQGTALEAALALPVAAQSSSSDYRRDYFGDGWIDVDANGCDTRNDILARDLDVSEMRGVCTVMHGVLDDPYTGSVIDWDKSDATAVQIDHVVALSNAWSTGASEWDFATRVAFANDPLNLLAVDGPTNASKSDDDASEWLPVADFRCDYVARQVAVKSKYGLWVTSAEQEAMTRVLDGCQGLLLPDYGDQPTTAANLGGQTDPMLETAAAVTGAAVTATAPAPAETTTAPAPAETTQALDPDYGTCKEAIAHDAGPYVQGVDPEYAWYTDRDHDGVVCER
ncbi:DUF1524 domain-containing protein [Demequina capsici]|uniref:DUF1524 domain-containing protein n=1 Tax=Demequina capsici TaxID=3075620 RepID=A0AA96JC77_9MICO|nr:DUF1524 domain-containing protein [Demequina sp. PMTSA13]WNM26536.1 DUF1524 domain-containing protein [Demequina sp. PMTSA13]